MYIGLTGSGTDWTWDDGTKLNYTNWQTKQPDFLDSQLCGSIVTSHGELDFYQIWVIGGWDNVECGVPYDGICQLPAKG